MQIRVDLYGGVHKALRARMFDLAFELDRCDFTRALELAVALGAYRRTMGFLREHHAHEDSFIEPALEECGSDLRAAVAAQHDAANAALGELDALVAILDRGSGERGIAGAQLCARYRRFLADYLAHLNHEETVVNEALWARYTDDELGALRGRLQGSIPPPRFGEWLEIMLPALNLGERAGMLRGIKAGAPAPAFAAATAIAARVLGSAAWEAVRNQID